MGGPRGGGGKGHKGQSHQSFCHKLPDIDYSYIFYPFSFYLLYNKKKLLRVLRFSELRLVIALAYHCSFVDFDCHCPHL